MIEYQTPAMVINLQRVFQMSINEFVPQTPLPPNLKVEPVQSKIELSSRSELQSTVDHASRLQYFEQDLEQVQSHRSRPDEGWKPGGRTGGRALYACSICQLK